MAKNIHPEDTFKNVWFQFKWLSLGINISYKHEAIHPFSKPRVLCRAMGNIET